MLKGVSKNVTKTRQMKDACYYRKFYFILLALLKSGMTLKHIEPVKCKVQWLIALKSYSSFFKSKRKTNVQRNSVNLIIKRVNLQQPVLQLILINLILNFNEDPKQIWNTRETKVQQESHQKNKQVC